MERHHKAERKPLIARRSQRDKRLVFPSLELRTGIGFRVWMPVPFVCNVRNHSASPPAKRQHSHSQDNAQAGDVADDCDGVRGDHAAALSGLGRGAPKIRSSAVTEPFVAATIALIISADGNCSPYRRREIDAAVVPASLASLVAVCPFSERY